MNGKSSSEVIPAESKKFDWVSGIAWLIALVLVVATGYLGWERWQGGNQYSQPASEEVVIRSSSTPADRIKIEIGVLPVIEPFSWSGSIPRKASWFTNIPNRPRRDVLEYSVGQGDSVFAIAGEFNLEPETVLWSNFDVLKDNPHAVSTGMVLKIPPTNGVYYQWKENDSLDSVAAEFKTDVDAILNWSGNRLDLTDPEISADSWVMIPGGQREFQQWIVPVMPCGAAGVSSGVYGGGACPGGYEGIYGSGGFIWPTINRTISGNDYWSGHLAIDIGSALGEPIAAADSGVIVFAGWATGGYGYTVAIDHGNGYQTLYAHLSSVNTRCGLSVVQGQTIGYGGSSGNSTGPHLHFEIRYQGGFANPWYVLPSP